MSLWQHVKRAFFVMACALGGTMYAYVPTDAATLLPKSSPPVVAIQEPLDKADFLPAPANEGSTFLSDTPAESLIKKTSSANITAKAGDKPALAKGKGGAGIVTMVPIAEQQQPALHTRPIRYKRQVKKEKSYTTCTGWEVDNRISCGFKPQAAKFVNNFIPELQANKAKAALNKSIYPEYEDSVFRQNLIAVNDNAIIVPDNKSFVARMQNFVLYNWRGPPDYRQSSLTIIYYVPIKQYLTGQERSPALPGYDGVFKKAGLAYGTAVEPHQAASESAFRVSKSHLQLPRQLDGWGRGGVAVQEFLNQAGRGSHKRYLIFRSTG